MLGAHSDDIEIGCGGAVRVLLERYPGAEVRWVGHCHVGGLWPEQTGWAKLAG